MLLPLSLCPHLPQRGGITYGEAGGCCPNTVALAVEDGGLIEIAGANQAS